MVQDYTAKIEFPLLQYALPLSIGSNLILILSFIPYILLWYFFRHTWLGEGILVIPALITYLFLRYKLSAKEHNIVNPLTLVNNILYFPGNLRRNKQPINMNLTEISEIKFTKLPYYSTKINKSWYRVIIIDKYNRVIKINGFAMDLNKFENVLKKYNLNVTYCIDPIFKWATLLLIILAIIFVICSLSIYN